MLHSLVHALVSTAASTGFKKLVEASPTCNKTSALFHCICFVHFNVSMAIL